MMLGAGALVGVGALGFWSTLVWAVGGAVVGDGLSYLIGHRFKDRLLRLRFVRARPELIARGKTFFQRHGGKSILLARFVGPVRPLVPVVAGMLGMPPGRFYLNNVLSALLWAPAYLIPGMVFGASLALAGQVAGRLALLLAGLVLFLWLVVAIARALNQWFQRHAEDLATGIGRWGGRHRLLAWLIGDLLDPERPVSRPLLLWLALLIGGSWLFFGVLEDVVSPDALVFAGQSLYHFLQQLRTPMGDRVMTVITESGDRAVAAPVVAAVLGWLLWRRAWRDAVYWVTAIAFGLLAVAAFKVGLHLPRPVDLYSGLSAYSFPSGHAMLTTVIYGFLAVLSAPSLAPSRRWMPYATAALLICAIAFSRLYLGAHWLVDVLAGIGLGSAWVSVLAIARARRPDDQKPAPGLAQMAALVFLTAAAWHVNGRLSFDMQRYAVRVPVQVMDKRYWWDSGWRQLPAYRVDLKGELEQPLNIQWSGDIQKLRQTLMVKGWRKPLELTGRSAMHWLMPRPNLGELPLLPQLHNGHDAVLTLIHPDDTHTRSGQQLILRIWPTAVAFPQLNTPVWVGSVNWQGVECLPLLCYLDTIGDYDAALSRLRPGLRNLAVKVVQRHAGTGEDGEPWSGDTLLAAAYR